MISSDVFENLTASMADAERADLVEALLRGELAREDYQTIVNNQKKR